MLFFFNDTATTEIYTLSLHDALPIFRGSVTAMCWIKGGRHTLSDPPITILRDRKSTRLNSSHLGISYAVFCLKKIRCTRTVTARPGQPLVIANEARNADRPSRIPWPV